MADDKPTGYDEPETPPPPAPTTTESATGGFVATPQDNRPDVTEAARMVLQAVRAKYAELWPASPEGQDALRRRIVQHIENNFGATKEELAAYTVRLTGDQAGLQALASLAARDVGPSAAAVKRDYQGDAARLVDRQLLQSTGRVDPEVRSKIAAFIPKYFQPGVDPAQAFQAFSANLPTFAEDSFDDVMGQRFDEAWDDGKGGGWYTGLNLFQQTLPQDSFTRAQWKVTLAAIQGQRATLKQDYLADLKTFTPGADSAMDHRVVNDSGYIFSPQEFLRLRAPAVLDQATGGVGSVRPTITAASADITTINARAANDLYTKQSAMQKALQTADDRLEAAQRAIPIAPGQIGPDIPEWASIQRTRDSLMAQSGQLVRDYGHDLDGYKAGLDPLAYLDLKAPGRMVFDHLGDETFAAAPTFSGTIASVLRNAAAPRLAKEQAATVQRQAEYTAEAQKRIGKVKGSAAGQFDPAGYLTRAGNNTAIALDLLDRDLGAIQQEQAATEGQAKQAAAVAQARKNTLSTMGRLAATTLAGGAGGFTPARLEQYVAEAGGDLTTAMNNFRIDLDEAAEKDKKAAGVAKTAADLALEKAQWEARGPAIVATSGLTPDQKARFSSPASVAQIFADAETQGVQPDALLNRIIGQQGELARQQVGMAQEQRAKAGFLAGASSDLQASVAPHIFPDLLWHLDLGSLYDTAVSQGQDPTLAFKTKLAPWLLPEAPGHPGTPYVTANNMYRQTVLMHNIKKRPDEEALEVPPLEMPGRDPGFPGIPTPGTIRRSIPTPAPTVIGAR